MANYLILCSDYLSPSDANGICIRNVVNELNRKEDSLCIISESDTSGLIYSKNNIYVYGVKRTWFAFFLKKYGTSGIFPKAVQVFRAGFAMFLYPNVSPIRSYRVYNLAKQLIEQYKVDTIVCAYRPFESLWAGMKLKTVFPTLHVIGYHLDLLMAANNTSAAVREYKCKKAHSFFEKERNKFDKIILPKSVMDQNYGDGNIVYADFPMFVTDYNRSQCEFTYDDTCINFSYIGSVDGSNREIIHLVSVLEGVQKIIKKSIRLNLWGNVSPYVLEYIKENSMVQYHGLVDAALTYGILRNADFVVNLSNKNTPEMIPSKIFQLFSSLTPILNVVENPLDKSLPYFARNDFACSIYAYKKDVPADIDTVARFISDLYGRKQVRDKVESFYEESRPAYVADLIIEK
jgi:hypothetical protein